MTTHDSGAAIPQHDQDEETREEREDRERFIAEVAAAVLAAALALYVTKKTVEAWTRAGVLPTKLATALARSLSTTAGNVHRASFRYARILSPEQGIVWDINKHEQKFAIEFARRSAARVMNAVDSNLQAAVEKNPDISKAELQRAYDEVLERELKKELRFSQLHVRASAQRVHRFIEMDRTKRDSPDGAYWTLDLSLTSHTPGCVAMSYKAWSWEALAKVNPAVMHLNCGCTLHSLQMARAAAMPNSDVVRTKLPKVAISEVS